MLLYSRLNGWTDWGDIFLWTLRGGRGVFKALKKLHLKKKKNLRATPGPSAGKS